MFLGVKLHPTRDTSFSGFAALICSSRRPHKQTNLDDILITSRDREEHEQHLTVLFDRLQKHGLVLKLEKCLFGVPEIDFLGHHVSRHGIIPLTSRVQAIKDVPAPTTVKELERFIGMVNFYNIFIPHAHSELKSLF